MHETLSLALALVRGVLLSAIFFGGLWWTVGKCVLADHPGLWCFGSVWLRMSIVLTGFYFVGHGSWERLLACLGGFVVARVIVTRLTQAIERPTDWAPETSHAS
jgi:F1F0 ATPase subunit 2